MSDIFLKILILGDSFVGKTSLLLKFIDGEFSESHIATIGVEFKEKIVNVMNHDIKLQIWDTSGQERFRSITQNFYRNADGIMLVFDITNRTTYSHIRDWLNEIQSIDKNIKIILIGNKIDRENERKIDKKTVEEFAQNKNLPYYETSAKTGHNVNEIYKGIAELLLANKTDEEIKEQFVKIQNSLSISSDNEESSKTKNKKKCC